MCGLDGDLRSQLLSIAGTIAFIVIEDLALLDAFYLTISTMGFGDLPGVQPGRAGGDRRAGRGSHCNRIATQLGATERDQMDCMRHRFHGSPTQDHCTDGTALEVTQSV